MFAPSKSILLAFAVLGAAVNSSLGAALPSTEGGCVASLLHHAGIPTTHSVQYELALAKSGVSFPQVSLFPPNILSALGVTDPGYASTLFSCVHGGKCASYHHCSKRGRCVSIRNGTTPGSPPYACQCLEGFVGVFCEHSKTPCHPNPCGNGGTCTTRGVDFVCSCKPGFAGRQCESHWLSEHNFDEKLANLGTMRGKSEMHCNAALM